MSSLPKPSLSTLATLAKRTALLVYIADVIYCYQYMDNYYLEAEDPTETEAEKLAQDALILEQYRTNCSPGSVVSKDEFETQVQQAMDYMERDADGEDVLKHRLASTFIKTNRESIVFAGGGRATYLQLAHPFIAAGIRDHSYLQRGVKSRFFNTFKYMFGLTFGTGEEVVKAAKGIRGLHAKVHGDIEEEVGVFSAKARFDANQKDAMRYVQWTLAETQVFEYELHVQRLTEEEKDSIARQSAKYLLLFGVPMQKGEETITWKQFMRRFNAMLRSKLTTVSDAALDTQEYILLPPGPLYAPLMHFVKYSTLISLPPRLAIQYGGRAYDSWPDKLFFAISHGLIRFLYRLTPGSFRYLAAYWKMHERAYGPRGMVSNLLSNLSSAIVQAFLFVLMPDRDEATAVATVQAIKATRVPFNKVEDSPLLI